MKASRILVAAGVLALTTAAFGQYTFPSFNQTVTSTAGSVALPVGPVPAGLYTSYSVSLDWSAIAGFPWSNEAIWALTNDPIGPPLPSVFYADPGPSPNGASNDNPVTLNWNGFLDVPYQGGDPLHFAFLQTFGGSSAQWNNISITLGFDTIAPPAAIDLGNIGPGMTMVTGQLNPGQVIWYKFTVPAIRDAFGEYLVIDTFGSTLTGGTFGSGNDSELGVYRSTGSLVATNDDCDFPSDLLSCINFGADQFLPPLPSGDLTAGTYYIALGGFNTTYGPAFNATSTSPVNGQYKLTLTTNVPEPTTMGLLALAGLAGLRRRR